MTFSLCEVILLLFLFCFFTFLFTYLHYAIDDKDYPEKYNFRGGSDSNYSIGSHFDDYCDSSSDSSGCSDD